MPSGTRARGALRWLWFVIAAAGGGCSRAGLAESRHTASQPPTAAAQVGPTSGLSASRQTASQSPTAAAEVGPTSGLAESRQAPSQPPTAAARVGPTSGLSASRQAPSQPPTAAGAVQSPRGPSGLPALARPLTAAPPSSDALPDAFLAAGQIIAALAGSPLRDLHAVGSTSTVFRASLDGASFRAAFKAATRDRPRGPIAEVGAYRLARCLELASVPPAALRRVPQAVLHAALDPATTTRWAAIEPRLLADRAGAVEGAAILWIEGLRDAPVAAGQGRAIALAALASAEPLPPLAAELSDLLVFDALIGNWDRWSGANVQSDAGGRLCLRDNDAGFAPRLPAGRDAGIFAPLRQCRRFSRRLIQRLRALTRESFEHELRQDPGFTANPARIAELGVAGVFERRERVLAHVQALIDAHGEDNVLSLP